MFNNKDHPELSHLINFLEWAEALFLEEALFFGHGTDNAWDEAVAIALHVLRLPPDVDASVANRALTREEQAQLQTVAKLRVQTRKPLPYLIQEAWFAGERYYIDERALIPRSPFAELIDQGFQPWLGDFEPLRILDLCTGSGCIAIACHKAFPKAQVDAVDLFPEVLAVAEKNCKWHACEDSVRLIASDLFQALKGERYDLIVTNPPYVSAAEMSELPPEYQHEPKSALVSENAGLAIPSAILKQAAAHLTPRGFLFLEVGAYWQALEEAHPELPWTWVELERGGEGIAVFQRDALQNLGKALDGDVLR